MSAPAIVHVGRESAPDGVRTNAQFTVGAKALWKAIAAVAIFEPPAITPDGESGFLVVVAKDAGYVYNRDGFRVLRARFPLLVVETEGIFILPAAHVRGFFHLAEAGSEALSFTARTLIVEGPLPRNAHQSLDEHHVEFVSSGGARAIQRTYAPGLMGTCDRSFSAATTGHVYSAALLREAITVTLPCVAGNRQADPNFAVLQALGRGAGNGVVYASDGRSTVHFAADDFRDKGFVVHRDSLRHLATFLRSADETVEVRSSETHTFVLSGDHLFGWARHELALTAYVATPTSSATIVTVRGTEVLKGLAFVRGNLKVDSKTKRRDKALCVAFDGAQLALQLRAPGVERNLSVEHVATGGGYIPCDLDIDSFEMLFKGARADALELGFGPEGAYTVERFSLAGHSCSVTRATTAAPPVKSGEPPDAAP